MWWVCLWLNRLHLSVQRNDEKRLMGGTNIAAVLEVSFWTTTNRKLRIFYLLINVVEHVLFVSLKHGSVIYNIITVDHGYHFICAIRSIYKLQILLRSDQHFLSTFIYFLIKFIVQYSLVWKNKITNYLYDVTESHDPVTSNIWAYVCVSN